MKKIIVATAALAALVLTGCENNAANPTDKGGNLDGTYEVGTIVVDGETLTCVTMKRGAGETSWGGLWCFPPEQPQPVTP